jgi:hypothetical protein
MCGYQVKANSYIHTDRPIPTPCRHVKLWKWFVKAAARYSSRSVYWRSMDGRSLPRRFGCFRLPRELSQRQRSDSVLSCIYEVAFIFFFLVVKGPAAEAADAPQPWDLLCNPFFPCNTEQRWNKTDRGKPKYSGGKNLSQCHFVHHKSQMDWSRIESGPSRWWISLYCVYCVLR